MAEMDGNEIVIKILTELDRKSRTQAIRDVDEIAKTLTSRFKNITSKAIPRDFFPSIDETGNRVNNRYYKIFRQDDKFYRANIKRNPKHFKFLGAEEVSSEYVKQMTKTDYSELENIFNNLPKFEDFVENTGKTVSKTIKKSGIEKFLKTFKRIGFYRISRGIFSLLRQGFTSGIKNLAEASPEVNKNISQLTSSLTTLANSATAILLPLLKIAEPLLQGITNLVAGLANGISYLTAKLQGNGEYLKINTDYLKKFNEQANKLSFDKFEALSGSNLDVSKMFTKTSVTEGFLNAVGDLNDELFAISGLVGIITGAKVIDGVKKLFDTISGGLTKTNGPLALTASYLLSVFALVYDLKEIFDNIKYAIENWDFLSTAQQVTYALKTILLVLSSILIVVGLLLKKPTWVTAGLVGSAGYMITQISGFANGGVPKTGSLFVAGEAGAELVTTMPSGQTGVTNIAQFKQAMVEALYEASDVFRQPDNSTVVEIDGAVVARSKTFRNELNRTQPFLAGKII